MLKHHTSVWRKKKDSLLLPGLLEHKIQGTSNDVQGTHLNSRSTANFETGTTVKGQVHTQNENSVMIYYKQRGSSLIIMQLCVA